jgi:hypothetical protein
MKMKTMRENKLFRVFCAAMLVGIGLVIAVAAYATTVSDKMTFSGLVTFLKGPVFSAATATVRGVAYTLPSADGSASQYLQTDGSKTLAWASGTSGSLDDGYNAGAGITVDAAAVQLNTGHATNDMLVLAKTTGSGDALQITNSGTGKDVNGTSGTWHVDKAGLGTFVGLTSTGAVTLSGAKIAAASPLVFEGTTVDGTNLNTFAITDPTAARVTTFPNATGTVKLNATATKNWGGAHADWTLDVNEVEASYITGTNADAGVNVLLSAAKPGACFFINNASGQIITFKVTGQTGGTIANAKRAFYCSDAVDVYEIWEQS